MKIFFAPFLLIVFLSSPALSGSCLQLLSAIDTALENKEIPFDNRAMLRLLRNKGMKLHQAGKHAESEDVLTRALAQAKKVTSEGSGSEGGSGGGGGY